MFKPVDKIVKKPIELEKGIPCFASHMSIGSHGILRELIKKAAKPGMICLELGSYAGESASCFLPTIKENNGILYCVDTWERFDDETQHPTFNIFKHNMEAQEFSDIVVPIKNTSEYANNFFKDQMFDFIYIDADHHYSSVINELNWFYPKVKKGGIIAGHDCEMKLTDCCDINIVEKYADLDWYGLPEHTCVPTWMPFPGLHCGVVLAVGEFFKDKEYFVKDKVFYHFKG